MTAPQTILEPGKFLKQAPRRNSLQTVNELGKLMRWLRSHHNVNVVNFVFRCKQFNIGFLAQLAQQCRQSIANFARQNSTPIFHAPNNVKLKLVYRMTTRLKVVLHTVKYNTTNSTNNANLLFLQKFRKCNQLSLSRVSNPLRDVKFIPSLKEGVFFHDLIKPSGNPTYSFVGQLCFVRAGLAGQFQCSLSSCASSLCNPFRQLLQICLRLF